MRNPTSCPRGTQGELYREKSPQNRNITIFTTFLPHFGRKKNIILPDHQGYQFRIPRSQKNKIGPFLRPSKNFWPFSKQIDSKKWEFFLKCENYFTDLFSRRASRRQNGLSPFRSQTKLSKKSEVDRRRFFRAEAVAEAEGKKPSAFSRRPKPKAKVLN